MAVVYKHIRLDSNIPFYIGIGKDEKRAYEKRSRNKHWNHVAKKCGYSVEIIHSDVSWEFACEKEIELIEKYKRTSEGGTLVNLTAGGEGTLGWKHDVPYWKDKKLPEYMCQRLSQIASERKGEKNPFFGKKHSEIAKNMMSEKRKGIEHSSEAKSNIKEGLRNSDKFKNSADKRIMKGEKNGKSSKVIDFNTGIIYPCIREASEKLNIPYSRLRAYCQNLVKKVKNFQYVKDDEDTPTE
jgi:hypothetical protein